ncbi:PadR family transcriptional regulator [Actinomadura fulvescens]|uniref:PadR family transcriptional regulator n=1 Tax=Actinomadura fulvescens TaxID=46160 RepID=A0ABN3Q1R8_9ACTN
MDGTMPGRRTSTSPLALAVLSTLVERPMHPYEIAQRLKHRGKDQSIKIRYGSLYTVVQNLADRGLVEAEGTARAGRRPERTVYRITAAGRAELVERLRELVRTPAKEYPLFEAALSLVIVLSPDEAAGLLSERLRVLEKEMAAARAALADLMVAQGMPRLFLLESEYALALKQAEAGWVRAMVTELADGSFDGLAIWRAWHETGEVPAEMRQADWFRADQELDGAGQTPLDQESEDSA